MKAIKLTLVFVVPLLAACVPDRADTVTPDAQCALVMDATGSSARAEVDRQLSNGAVQLSDVLRKDCASVALEAVTGTSAASTSRLAYPATELVRDSGNSFRDGKYRDKQIAGFPPVAVKFLEEARADHARNKGRCSDVFGALDDIAVKTPGPGTRRIIVLSDMMENCDPSTDLYALPLDTPEARRAVLDHTPSLGRLRGASVVVYGLASDSASNHKPRDVRDFWTEVAARDGFTFAVGGGAR